MYLDLFVWFYAAELGELHGNACKALFILSYLRHTSNDKIFGSTVGRIKNTELKAILNKSTIRYNLIPRVQS